MHCRGVSACWLLLVSTSVAAAADRFVPQALYAYEVVDFPNGFRAVLNPRPASRNVAFRLLVDVGLLDFDCRDRELPHLVEHLMFAGPGDLGESDLDALVVSLGGTWNAYTHPWQTEYQLDIYSGHALEGLDILYRMFTGTALTQERLANGKAVVQAESGGEAGGVRQVLHGLGVGTAGVNESYRRFVPGSRAYCARVPTMEHIELATVDAFRATHHRPAAMLLFAVGDFDRAELLDVLEAGFAGLPAAGPNRSPRAAAELTARAARFDTTFAPFLGNTAYVTVDLFVGTPMPLTAEYFALHELAEHMDALLYDELRVSRGLAYTPGAALVDHGDFSTIMLEAEVAPGRVAEVLEVMRAQVQEVRRHGVDTDTLMARRRGTLYRFAAHLDSNASLADILVSGSRYFRAGAPLPDLDAALTALDAAAVRDLAGRSLSMDQALVYVAAPTLSFRALGWMLAGAGMLAVLWAVRWRRRVGSGGPLTRSGARVPNDSAGPLP